jgi:hypothetical protein
MKILAEIRDFAVIVLAVFVSYFVVSDHLTRAERRRAEEARLSVARNAISKLDEAYKKAVFNDPDNKGIQHQIFRQNEVLLEYQKLLLTVAHMPAPSGDVPPIP